MSIGLGASVAAFSLVALACLPGVIPDAVAVPLSAVAAIQSDGTAVFDADSLPGNDAGPNNGIVRTNDTVQYAFSYNFDAGGASDPRIDSTLPAGMEWTAVPTGCTGTATTPVATGIYDSTTGLPGGDNRRLICQIPSAAGSVTGSVIPTARVTIKSLNGSVNSVGFTVADSIGTVVTSNTVDVVTSSRAAYNLRKRLIGSATALGPDGVTPGMIRTYYVDVLVWHSTRTGTERLKGQAELSPNVTFTDSLAEFSPNARLFDWGTSIFSKCQPIFGAGLAPNSYLDPAQGATTLNSVPNSGTISCVSGTPGGTFSVSFTGMDTSGSSFPTQNGNGSSVAGNLYVATGRVPIWIPYSDVIYGADGVPGTGDDNQLVVRNTYTDFAPVDVNGQVNVPEPLGDNSVTLTLIAGYTASKAYRDYFTNNTPDGATGLLSGDLFASPGYKVRSLVSLVPTVVATTNTIMCDVFDNTAQELTRGPSGQAPGEKRTDGIPAGQSVIEYGAPLTQPTTFAQLRASTCSDAEATWSTDPTSSSLGGSLTANGFRSTIDRVRLRTLVDLPPDLVNWLTTYLQVKGTSTMDPTANPGGSVTANLGQIYTGASGWRPNSYDPMTSLGTYGDRITVVPGVVRVDKTTLPYAPGTGESAPPGANMTFRLAPTVTTPGTGSQGTVQDVVLTDVLPTTAPRLTVNPLSVTRDANVDSVEFCAACDGSDWSTSPQPTVYGVRWLYGSVVTGTVLAPVEFSVRVPSRVANGTSYSNTAVISSSTDTSIASRRSGSAGIQAAVPSSVLVSKSTPDPLAPLNGTWSWTITARNSTTTDLTRFDVVDVLPFVGDGRTPSSAFSGELLLGAVSGLPAGMAAYVTSSDPSGLDSADGNLDGYADPGNPGDAWYVAPGTGIWACTTTQLGQPGCPTAANATAVRFSTPPGSGDVVLAAGAIAEWTLGVTGVGDAVGDMYTNRFIARTDPAVLPLPALSADVPVAVIAPQIALSKDVCLSDAVDECDAADDALWAGARSLPLGSTAVFRLRVTNTGTIDGAASVSDELPDGLTFVPGSVQASAGDASAFPSTWSVGAMVPHQVETLVYRAVVGVLSGGEIPSQILNDATASISDRFSQRAAADAESSVSVVVPQIATTKTVLGSSFSGNSFTVSYEIAVSNSGGADGSYSISDALAMGDGVDVDSAIVSSAPVATDPTWDGASNTSIAADVGLPAGTTHRYRIDVAGTISPGIADSARDCTIDPGESGTGLMNGAETIVEGTPQSAVACAPVPARVSPTPSYSTSPSDPIPGPGGSSGGGDVLSGTGFDSLGWVALASLLGLGGVLLGAAVMRRRI